MMARQPPPVAPRSALQSWKQTSVDERYTNSSNDSRDSSSSEGSNRMSDLSPPSKTLGKIPPRNPLQFVKVLSPIYNKGEQQEKIPKEDKVPKEAFKEGEEEWQSKLDNWKSRRRKVTEKVLQRAEEMRQIEIKEQISQEHQKKIKKFSEIMGKKSTRSYSLSLYIDEKDDSGLGATPEPDDTLDSESSPLPSDTSEGRASEAEYIENDCHKTHKTVKKEPPKVPQKTYGRLMKSASISYDSNPIDSDELFQHCVSKKDLNNGSPSEPYDVEGSTKGPHATDTDAAFSSEEDTEISNQTGNTDSGIESLCDNRRGDLTDNLSDLSQDSSIGMEKNHKQLLDLTSNELEEDRKPNQEEATDIQMSNEYNQSFKICLKRQESKELDLNGEKDEGNSAYIENVIKDYINTEIKITESRKGKSFAEKLAIFTAGVNAPTVFPGVDEPKVEKMETKKESLVLRRRSAFENRNSVGTEKVLEKRHSVDFMLGQNVIHENNVNKKGPPPPVPVKPKIKSKSAYFDPNKLTLSTTGTNGNISLPDCKISSSDNISTSQEKSGILPVCSDSFKSNSRPKLANLKQSSINEPIDSNVMDVADISFSEQPQHKICTEINDPFSNRNHICLNESVEIPNSDLDEVGDQTTDKDFASFEANELEFKRDSSKQHVLETIDEMQSFCNNNKDSSSDIPEEELYKDSYEQDSNNGTFNDKICTGQNGSTNEISVTFVNNLSVKEYPIDFLNDTNLEACPEEILETPSEIHSNPSAYNSACDNEDVNKSHVSECHDIQEPEVYESKIEVQANSSPLCLSLEKIDEDDVVSASTTTSSDTPDTETVIETLPSNVSPLPNDESNGEDSSKLPNYLDEESENVPEAAETNEMSSSEKNDHRENVESNDKEEINSKEEVSQNYQEENVSVLKEAVQNYDLENINEEKDVESDDVFEQYDSPAADNVKDDEMQKMYYDKEEDDDYVYELEESLDQITSLDIIDRIEQSLMDQLQKENSNEDISPNLNCELDSDIDNPWLYYSDDLRPRHLEPPDRPPPPPPVEEEQDSGTDSTHRIKKELWRRRSDFLGLDLQETDDYDIPPPPPSGLEEFLKQEREQTQWLEKRLSLAEAETEISYSSKSTCVDSGKFSNSDYSDYFMEENNESPNEGFIHSESEQWKQNTVEESLYETPYGSQYEAVPEIPSPVIEENVKTPEHKTRQHIQDLGATPKAKIMDSSQWITEKFATEHKKPVEPIFRATNSNPNYWLAQDEEWRRSVQFADNHSDRRYSMPPVYSNTHPDITVRTWGDREYEYQQNRPRSAIYYKSGYGGNMYDQYGNLSKKELQHTQSLDTDKLMNYETDTLESEVHKCSCCGKGLCEGSAMGIEALRLYFHIECFRCRLCNMQLGNGSCGTDVQVKDNQLYCPSCFTVD